MPELPEVQTIVNDLQILTGDTITGFWTNFTKAIKSDDFEEKIKGQKIAGVKRLGKNIVIELANDTFIVAHLKMTGKLLLSNQKLITSNQKIQTKHLHHVFSLQKNGALEFHDIRKFATLELADKKRLSEIESGKGINPLSKEFTLKKFTELIEVRKNKSIKSFLMDQTAISGIGNIYASEIPYDAKLNPIRKLQTLSETERKSLFKSTLKILVKAISKRGTSFSDYRDAKGKKGEFQNYLKVYKKAGKSCAKCATIIEKNVIEQRSTFHCPTCQQ
ncbi:MAG: hypothetical protein ACD_56C00053G0002 [uncultured bacterium]|nr:MAG: hypothetical protein ACD_56C00053G0002 [uncultured bacterium]KKQ45194.1 MAG: Formamidopyrimidine-DNA glycosylase [Candidatus Moranbacteria bacterium GW2011_GWC2_37_8]KKQ60960.1 MAG: Formamidopyrimidine-DNA glycosylase [Parcubacteria group bacterium GW2011_GWC1_38_22]KKQ79481.1 MAG: Formamidopyrimidine-DNA glycosylase [Candidatus Moranbacteria bacterium GW2011_GWD2_38_7]